MSTRCERGRRARAQKTGGFLRQDIVGASREGGTTKCLVTGNKVNAEVEGTITKPCIDSQKKRGKDRCLSTGEV